MRRGIWLGWLCTVTLAVQAETGCYDRQQAPHTLVVDSHLHFQPFSGRSLDFQTLVGYLAEAGIRYANVYGIGQTRIDDWECLKYGRGCANSTIRPTMKNDFMNALQLSQTPNTQVGLTLSMTFVDLQNPETIIDRMALLDGEFPGLFRWMGEANLVKQSLFGWGHRPATRQNIDDWAPFMAVLRERNMPLALHSDLGNDDEPLKYLELMEHVLASYPDNTVVWMHLGLSREQTDMDAAEHTRLLRRLMDRYPNLWLDISWNVLYDYYFRDEQRRPYYVALMNDFAARTLTGTDLVANERTGYAQYERALYQNSYINQYLNDEAFRHIALGQSYFDLLGLDAAAPEICE
ncbi:MAG: amidohydrolase family protein [Saccharospirillum sp.]